MVVSVVSWALNFTQGVIACSISTCTSDNALQKEESGLLLYSTTEKVKNWRQ